MLLLLRWSLRGKPTRGGMSVSAPSMTCTCISSPAPGAPLLWVASKLPEASVNAIPGSLRR